jgi:hypothetical protein
MLRVARYRRDIYMLYVAVQYIVVLASSKP